MGYPECDDYSTDWFSWENLHRKPWFIPSNMMGFPEMCSRPTKGVPSPYGYEHGISWYIIQLLTVFCYIYIYWLVVEPYPLKNDGVSNSWGDDIPFPTVHGKSFNPFMETSHHQPVYLYIYIYHNYISITIPSNPQF